MKKKVDKNLFRAVKTIFKGGATNNEIADFFELSSATVTRIKQAETYEEYIQILAAMNLNIKEKRAKEKTEVPKAEEKDIPEKASAPTAVNTNLFMNSTYAQNRMIELIKEQNEILKCLSNKIAFIVEQLC